MIVPAGNTLVVFNVPIIDDKASEEDETFSITIDPSSLRKFRGVSVFPDGREARVIIVDEDEGKINKIIINYNNFANIHTYNLFCSYCTYKISVG